MTLKETGVVKARSSKKQLTGKKTSSGKCNIASRAFKAVNNIFSREKKKKFTLLGFLELTFACLVGIHLIKCSIHSIRIGSNLKDASRFIREKCLRSNSKISSTNVTVMNSPRNRNSKGAPVNNLPSPPAGYYP